MKLDLKKRMQVIQADISAVFIALKVPSTPWYAKALAFLTVAYALSPIDLIPDFIPVLGYLDDLILLPTLVAFTVKCIPKPVWEQAKKQADERWQEGKPTKWYYAVPVVLFWLILLLVVIKMLMPSE